MICRELDQYLHPYLDGEFDPADVREVDTHLSECPACTRAFEEEQRLREKIRESLRGGARAPDRLRHLVRTGLSREERRRQVGSWLRAGAVLAAAAALSGSVVFYRSQGDRRFVEEAVARHTRGLPFEIQGTSEQGVEAWFGGKLRHRVSVPSFRNTTLAGARLSNVTDKEAAYISYETVGTPQGPRRLGLFVFHDDRDEVLAKPLPALQVGNAQGYNVALWREGAIVYELVTDLEEQDIRQMLGHGLKREPSRPVLNVVPASFQPH